MLFKKLFYYFDLDVLLYNYFYFNISNVLFLLIPFSALLIVLIAFTSHYDDDYHAFFCLLLFVSSVILLILFFFVFVFFVTNFGSDCANNLVYRSKNLVICHNYSSSERMFLYFYIWSNLNKVNNLDLLITNDILNSVNNINYYDDIVSYLSNSYYNKLIEHNNNKQSELLNLNLDLNNNKYNYYLDYLEIGIKVLIITWNYSNFYYIIEWISLNAMNS